MFSGICSISTTGRSLVIWRACQHQLLTVEVKKSTQVTLLRLKNSAVFLHSVMPMVSENHVLEAR